MSQSQRFQHTGPKVSLCNRAQPFAGSHCCALLLCILLLGNRSSSAIGPCLTGPTHKQPTITELPIGTCPAQLLVSTAMGPTYRLLTINEGAIANVIKSRVVCWSSGGDRDKRQIQAFFWRPWSSRRLGPVGELEGPGNTLGTKCCSTP